MDSIVDSITQVLGTDGISQLSQRLGTDPQTTTKALAMAVPVLTSVLARNAQRPQGAQAIHQTLEKQSEQLLDNVSGYVQNPQQVDGSGSLQRLLGNQQQSVQQGLAQATGLNNNQVVKLLEFAAPLVISYFARQQHQQHLDPNGLAQALGQQTQQMQQANPGIAQMVGQVLGGSAPKPM